MYKNMTELLDEKEINGWKLKKFEERRRTLVTLVMS